MPEKTEFLRELTIFLDRLWGDLLSSGLQLDNLCMDHACFRTNSEDDYTRVKSEFSRFADLLTESPVNGRLIATYALREPFYFRGRCLRTIEVPAPKLGKSFPRGFEHVEFVLDESFSAFKARHPKLSFEMPSRLVGLNPEMQLRLAHGNVKFHYQALSSVIHLERKPGLLAALNSTRVFEALREFHPLIAGAMPLGVSKSDAELEIICQALNGDDFERVAREAFSIRKDFHLGRVTEAEMPTSCLRFSEGSLRFLVTCQLQSVFEQSSRRFFHSQTRLINLGGTHAESEIQQRLAAGIPIAQAFRECFDVARDSSTSSPEDWLLGLSTISEVELTQRLITKN